MAYQRPLKTYGIALTHFQEKFYYWESCYVHHLKQGKTLGYQKLLILNRYSYHESNQRLHL